MATAWGLTLLVLIIAALAIAGSPKQDQWMARWFLVTVVVIFLPGLIGMAGEAP